MNFSPGRLQTASCPNCQLIAPLSRRVTSGPFSGATSPDEWVNKLSTVIWSACGILGKKWFKVVDNWSCWFFINK